MADAGGWQILRATVIVYFGVMRNRNFRAVGCMLWTVWRLFTRSSGTLVRSVSLCCQTLTGTAWFNTLSISRDTSAGVSAPSTRWQAAPA